MIKKLLSHTGVVKGGIKTLLLTTVLLTALDLYAATITSKGTGNWNDAATWLGGVVPAAADDVIIADGHSVTLNQNTTVRSIQVGQGVSGILLLSDNSPRTLTVTGNVIISTGGAINCAGFVGVTGTLIMSGNLIVNGTFQSFTTQNRRNNIIFNGTTAQTISGNTNPITFNNITFNGSGGVTLNQNGSIVGVLTLSNGIVTTSSSALLTITNAGFNAISGGSSTSFVNGPLIRTFNADLNNAVGDYVFPVGRSGNYYPFIIRNTTTGAIRPVIEVEALAGNAGAASASLSFSSTEYWRASVLSGSFTSSIIELTRPTALGTFNLIANSPTQSGTYISLGGTTAGNVITSTSTAGSSLGFFIMAEETTGSRITSFNPTSVCIGSGAAITISGNSFVDVSNVTIGGQSATFTVNSSTEIVAILPSNAISGQIISATVAGLTVNSLETLLINEIPVAPAGSANQTFCSAANPTVANLVATGTAIQWYDAASGGALLTGTTALSNGTSYFASQTVSGCESATRLAVSVTITASPSTPTGSASQLFCSGANPTVANLVVSGTDIKWYDQATGGSLIAGSAALIDGNIYYASQTVSGCESADRLAVLVTINITPSEPTGSSTQAFCSVSNPTVANLAISGTDIRWYNEAIGGSPIAGTTTLNDATNYYATQTSSGCESARFSVAVTVTTTPLAPSGYATQAFCLASNSVVGDLLANGTEIKWYDEAIGGSLLTNTTALIDGVTYYASQTVSNCESVTRFAVTVSISTKTPEPTGESTQYFCTADDPKIADITLNGTNVQWFDEPTDGTLFLNNTPLTDGGVYYATQTIDGCGESETRLEVVVVINSTPAAPTGLSTQIFCSSVIKTIADLTATGTNIRWYDLEIGGAPLSAAQVLLDNSTYFASQTISGCESSTRFEVSVSLTILTNPIASNDGPVCEGSIVNLSASDIIGATFNWTGPDGFISDLQNPTATIAGTYSVTATINGCTSDAVNTIVELKNLPPSPVAFNNGTVCEGETVIVSCSDVTGATYNWTGPNGFVSSDQTLFFPISSLDNAGLYSVTATVDGCSSIPNTLYVYIIEIPHAPVVSYNDPICEGASINFSATSLAGSEYNWTGPNGFISNEQNPTILVSSFDDAGEYFVTANIDGCISSVASLEVEVKAMPIEPTAINDGPVCDGSLVNLSASLVPGATYNWTGPNGFSSNEQNPIVTEAGTYSVTVTLNGCMSDASETSVVIVAPPLVSVTLSNASCFGANNGFVTAIVNGGSGEFSYEWNTTPVQNTETATGLTAGSYSVMVTDMISVCSVIVSGNVSEPAALNVVGASSDATCANCADGSANISVTGGTGPYGYVWSSQHTSNIVTGLLPGNYTVIVTDANGCSETVVIEVGYTISVNEYIAGLKSVNIYPNPANAVINYSATMEGKELIVQLVDVQGRIIATTTHTSFDGVVTSFVNTSVLNPGIYQLRFISEKGVSNKKFIVAH
jgi:large repetitive protein